MAVTFTQQIFDRICERIADGESLRCICQDEDMPSMTAVFKWLAKDKDGAGTLVDQYARARETQADAIFDEILGIADNGHNDWMMRKYGDSVRWIENGEAINRSKLRIDARKWMAGKLRPKKYGESSSLEVTGKGGAPLIPVLNVTVGTDGTEPGSASQTG